MIEPKEFTRWSLAVLDTAAAHKGEARKRGFSEEASEAMAVTLHSVLMASLYDEVEGTDPGLDNPPEE